MASVTPILEQQLLVGGFRLGVQLDQIAEVVTTQELDASALGDTTVIKEPGAKGYGMSGEGFWLATQDDGVQGYHRARNVPVSLLLTDGSVGTFMRSFKSMVGGHEMLEGEWGGLARVGYTFGAMGAPVRGYVLSNSEETGNFTGSSVDLGAGPSGSQQVYAALHVFSGSGNLDVTIESDDNSGFTSATTRFTFAQVGTAVAQAYEWATPISVGERYWRVNVTNPATRDLAVVLAIQ